MSRHHRRKHRLKLRSFYIWHRYMGVSAAVFALLLAITGVILNHTERFRLDNHYVQSDWILDWYGIHAPSELLTFEAGDRYVTLMGEHLYLDTREIEGRYRHLVGAARVGENLVVAVDNNVLLLTPDGELIERLQGKDGVPSGMQRIGVDASGDLVIEGGHDLYQPDRDFLNWQHWDSDPLLVDWMTPVTLTATIRSSLQHHYRGEVLPVERVLLDLHSGRFFGRAGPWVIDAAAVILILLSLSGGWMWLRRRR